MWNRHYKWFLLALLGCAYFFHQADRALFGLLTLPIQSDLGLDKLQIGRINMVLSWTIAAVTFVAGFVGDRLSRKWIITLSLVFWSLATIGMGFAGAWQIGGFVVSAYLSVVLLRSLATGGGESFYGPSAMSLLASYHRETRSFAFSVHQAALYVGLMTSGILSAWALGLLGTWRRVFMAFGAAGLLLGIAFVWLLKDAPREAKAADAERGSVVGALKAYFGNPSALLATSGFVAIVCVNNAYLFWAPTLFAERFGVSVGSSGTHAMFYHHLFAFGAILAGGWVTDRFVKRWPRFRLGFQIVALALGAPALYLIGRADSFAGAVAMTAAYGLFRGLFEVNTHASVFDVVPARFRASVVGFMLLLAFFIGGWFSGDLMGRVLQGSAADGYGTCFRLMALTYAIAAALMSVSFFWTFRKDRQP